MPGFAQVKNLKRMQKQLQREGRLEDAAMYDFFPTTYVVPQEYGLFYEEFKRNPTHTCAPWPFPYAKWLANVSLLQMGWA